MRLKGVFKMKKVLIVEDDYYDRLNMKNKLEASFEVFEADNLSDAESTFFGNPDIDLIIMDACVPGHEPNSMRLVWKIKESGFKKPIIACSSIWQFSELLVQYGATHQAPKHKAAELAIELLTNT